jgi:2-C-methyl-D-erythritol 4-phosphate cytidylyltransferase
MNKEFGIIIVAGGTGTRFGGRNKLLEYIPAQICLSKPRSSIASPESAKPSRKQKTKMPPAYPVFIYSLLNFRGSCPDTQIILVCHSDLIEEFKKLTNEFIPGNQFIYTTGGAERYNSVINGLNALPGNVKYVAVHDAARPLAGKKLLIKCLESCKNRGSGVAAKKINDTVKRTINDGKVLETLDRTNLWAVETPQIFKIDELKAVYSKLLQSNASVTDDAGAMEKAGYSVYLVENPDINTKITHQSDIEYIRTLV